MNKPIISEEFGRFLGETLDNRYTLVSIIGIGESSVVFGAYDTESGETVALKMLKPSYADNRETATRFITEVRVLSLFDHPGIVRILDTSFEGEYKYFVMEYVEGITLKKHMENKGALSPGEILFFSKQILSALSAVHEKGIVHSDIKPQNIVILANGDIKLMDFGISRTLLGQQEEHSSTAVGTVQYVSPEQAEGKPLEIYSDIYSFGVMLYEMATGVLPFVAEDAGQIAAMHVSDTPIPPTILNPSISMGLQSIILRTMKKEPLDRYLSADDLLAELEVVLKKKPIKPSKVELLPAKVRFFFTSLHLPSGVAGALCALLCAVVFGLGFLSFRLTQTDDFIRIPSLCGQTYESVEALGLDLGIYDVRVTFVDNKQKDGKIVEQTPRGGIVKKKTGDKITVELEVAKKDLPPVMPDFSFWQIEAVLNYLCSFDTEMPRVERLPHGLLPSGTVIATVPGSEEPLDGISREIVIYVSDGYRENTQIVPDLVGLSKQDAAKKALENGFSGLAFRGTGKTVISQSPAAGTAADAAGISLILQLE